MHKLHQKRMTTISNQLNQQHAEQMNKLRDEYEYQLASLRDQLPDKAQNVLQEQKAELEKKLQVDTQLVVAYDHAYFSPFLAI